MGGKGKGGKGRSGKGAKRHQSQGSQSQGKSADSTAPTSLKQVLKEGLGISVEDAYGDIWAATVDKLQKKGKVAVKYNGHDDWHGVVPLEKIHSKALKHFLDAQASNHSLAHTSRSRSFSYQQDSHEDKAPVAGASCVVWGSQGEVLAVKKAKKGTKVKVALWMTEEDLTSFKNPKATQQVEKSPAAEEKQPKYPIQKDERITAYYGSSPYQATVLQNSTSKRREKAPLQVLWDNCTEKSWISYSEITSKKHVDLMKKIDKEAASGKESGSKKEKKGKGRGKGRSSSETGSPSSSAPGGSQENKKGKGKSSSKGKGKGKGKKSKGKGKGKNAWKRTETSEVSR